MHVSAAREYNATLATYDFNVHLIDRRMRKQPLTLYESNTRFFLDDDVVLLLNPVAKNFLILAE